MLKMLWHRTFLRKPSSITTASIIRLMSLTWTTWSKVPRLKVNHWKRLFAALKVAYSTTQLRSGTILSTGTAWHRTPVANRLEKSLKLSPHLLAALPISKLSLLMQRSKTLVLAGPGWWKTAMANWLSFQPLTRVLRWPPMRLRCWPLMSGNTLITSTIAMHVLAIWSTSGRWWTGNS